MQNSAAAAGASHDGSSERAGSVSHGLRSRLCHVAWPSHFTRLHDTGMLHSHALLKLTGSAPYHPGHRHAEMSSLGNRDSCSPGYCVFRGLQCCHLCKP